MDFDELQSFCWTRMQAEGGQSLHEILRRKELERAAGNGIFYWGVGNSLGMKTSLITSGKVNKVVFSRMLSSPKKIDVNPSAISLWFSWKDSSGNMGSLPPHVAVISRAHSKRGVKKRHYALVCRSEESLLLRKDGFINTAKYRNYASNNPRIGHSLVTTILERNNEGANGVSELGNIYEVNLIAQLVEPYFVTLLNPVILTPAEALEMKSIFVDAIDPHDYFRRINQFRENLTMRSDFFLE